MGNPGLTGRGEYWFLLCCGITVAAGLIVLVTTVLEVPPSSGPPDSNRDAEAVTSNTDPPAGPIRDEPSQELEGDTDRTILPVIEELAPGNPQTAPQAQDSPDEIVEGRIVSRTGRYRRPTILELTCVELAGRNKRKPWLLRSIRAEVSWRETADARWIGDFHFDSVPPGRWLLHAPTDTTTHSWVPEQVEITPPATGLELVCQDDVETLSLGFVVRDVETGSLVPRFNVKWTDGRSDPAERDTLRKRPISRSNGFRNRCRAYTAVIKNHPANRPLEWTIQSANYNSVSGNHRDFQPNPEYDSLLLAEVYLRPSPARRKNQN